MYRKKIQQLVCNIMQQYDLNVIPVNIEALAKYIGAEIKRDDFDAALSGFALQKNGSKYIGVNSLESHERQRFTIAHEIGHLFLHKEDKVNYDTGAGVVLLRDVHSSQGTDTKEIEANRFAAELLMPEESIRQELSNHGDIDLMAGDEKSVSLIEELAAKYEVSFQAMSIRLTTLYFN